MKITDALKFISSHIKCLTIGHSCPLTFKAGNSICKIKLLKVGTGWSGKIYKFSYKYEKNNLTSYSIGSQIVLQPYDTVQFFGKQSYFSESQFKYFQFSIQSQADVKVYGNVMSLVNFSTNILYDFQFCKLFKNCKSIISAPILPAKHLKMACYFQMFANCIKLTEAPILPASILKQFCYASMFQRCTSITSMPKLRATKLKGFCYLAMFQGCSNLFENITLPAKQLVRGCYIQMFLGCNKIRTMRTSFEDWNISGQSTYYWVYDVVPHDGEACLSGKFFGSSNICTDIIQYAREPNDYRYIPPEFDVYSNGIFTYFPNKFLGRMNIITPEETIRGHLNLNLNNKISKQYIDESCRIIMSLSGETNE